VHTKPTAWYIYYIKGRYSGPEQCSLVCENNYAVLQSKALCLVGPHCGVLSRCGAVTNERVLFVFVYRVYSVSTDALM
jgi:hypothetical protein